MKKLLLFFALCASLGAWAQSVNKSYDGNILTLTCSGNVANMANVDAPTGEKEFTAAAKEGNKYGNVLTNNGDMESYPNVGTVCGKTTQYYLKVYTYTDQQTPGYDNIYYLKNNVYQFDGTSTYSLKEKDSSCDIEGSFFSLEDAGEVAGSEDIELGGEKFDASCEGWVYTCNSETWDGQAAVKAGDTFDSSKNYFIANGQNSPNWNDGILADPHTTLTNKKYLINAISSTSTLYKVVGSTYVKAAGTAYDASATYYKNVELVEISDITSQEYTTQVSFVNVSDDNWRIRVEEDGEFVYYSVKNGDAYDATAVYVKLNGATAQPITYEDLEAKGFITDQYASVPFWQAMTAEINAWVGAANSNGVYPNKTVIVTSADPANIAEIDNSVVHAFMACNIRQLDLSGVYLEEIVSPFYRVEDGVVKTDYNNKGTFCQENAYTQTPNLTIETLYTPQVKKGGILRRFTFCLVPNLKYLFLSDGITELAEKSISGADAPYLDRLRLSTIKFPNTLEYIRSTAVEYHNVKGATQKDLDGNDIEYIRTLTFPASLKEIETGAFTQTCPKDVYFLGLEAPKVGIHAWGDDAYVSNSTLQLSATGVGEGDEKVTAYFGEGYATRANYNSTNGWMCMLHYPAECTPAQAAKYTDPIRDYRRIDWDWDVLQKQISETGVDTRYIYYTPGKEADGALTAQNGSQLENLQKSFKQEYNPQLVYNLRTGKNEPIYIDADGNVYMEKDENGELVYRDPSNNYEIVPAGTPGAENCPEFDRSKIAGESYYDYRSNPEYNDMKGGINGNNFDNGIYGGDYDGAYYDIFLGNQYTWPSMPMALRATLVAQNGVTWDGVTTIGEQIKARLQDDETYEGDGSEYIGLHQFVFTSGDGIGGGKTTTNEWDLDKFADGKWHSICVPFDMTKRQMKETFGKKENDEDGNPVYDIRLCKFSDVIRNRDQVTLQFNDEQFDKAGVSDDDVVLHAHVSYMIWADANREFTQNANITFKNYVIKDGDPIVTKIMSHSDAEAEKDKAESIEYRFVGNYKKYHDSEQGTMARALVPVTIPQYSYYFSFSSQQFRFMQGDNTSPWNPYAAVVLLPEGVKDNNAYFETPASTSKVRTSLMGEMAEDEATTIEDVTIEINNEIVYTNSNVYNLKGQKVGNSIEGLSQGIYIVNGKKYFVK